MLVIPGPEETRAQERAEERRQIDTLSATMRDLRALLSAEETVFFRYTRTRETIEAAAWSTEGAERPSFRVEWIPFVQETARGHGVRLARQDGGDDGPIVLACAPVGEIIPIGALSATSAVGFALDADELRRRLTRYASMLARIAELSDARREGALETLRVNAILGAVQHFQSVRSNVELGRAICGVALQVTHGSRAALVRWHRGGAGGHVEGSAGADAVPPGLGVDLDSLVGHVCRTALAQVWENARLATQVQPVFGAREPARVVGSLGIYPLRDRSHAVVGAIVVEGEEAGAVRIRAMRDVRLLSLYAAMSLETIWEIEEVSHRARTDLLTGLPNRRHFEERLGWLLDEIDRFGGAASLVVVDIDHFKHVNDTHGHEAGDAVLRHVANVMATGVRDVDLCARFGGEELVLLLPQTGSEGARELAERLRQSLEARPARHGTLDIPVTASFGVASYPAGVRRRDELFDAADRAMYEAKREGRNRVACA